MDDTKEVLAKLPSATPDTEGMSGMARMLHNYQVCAALGSTIIFEEVRQLHRAAKVSRSPNTCVLVT